MSSCCPLSRPQRDQNLTVLVAEKLCAANTTTVHLQVCDDARIGNLEFLDTTIQSSDGSPITVGGVSLGSGVVTASEVVAGSLTVGGTTITGSGSVVTIIAPEPLPGTVSGGGLVVNGVVVPFPAAIIPFASGPAAISLLTALTGSSISADVADGASNTEAPGVTFLNIQNGFAFTAPRVGLLLNLIPTVDLQLGAFVNTNGPTTFTFVFDLLSNGDAYPPSATGIASTAFNPVPLLSTTVTIIVPTTSVASPINLVNSGSPTPGATAAIPAGTRVLLRVTSTVSPGAAAVVANASYSGGVVFAA